MEENGDITEDYLQGLVTDKVAEDRTIEYKANLPDGTDASKKEFLSDVSAFANANGGRILYGIEEGEDQLKGVPVEISGLPEDTVIDKTILRLESMLRDGVAPRIFGVRIYGVLLGNRKYVIAVQVPKSWNGPHMVTFAKHSRFYLRGNAGKSLMDVYELRDAFAQTGALPEKARRFRDERLARILNGETPVPLRNGPSLVFHVISQSAFGLASHIDIGSLSRFANEFTPRGRPGHMERFNADGYVVFSNTGRPATSYCQVFRTGLLEAVWSEPFRLDGQTWFLNRSYYERHLVGAAKRYLQRLCLLGVSYPAVLMLSMLQAEGCRMSFGERHVDASEPMDREHALLPEVVLDSLPTDFPQALRPILDAVSNAFDLPRSYGFDEEGNWKYNSVSS